MHLSERAAFLNQKGGVGKTTSVVNVGAGLTILGKKVLLVDLDPQGHLTSFLGIEPHEITRTIYDVLRGDVHPREAIITRPLNARFCINGEESQLSISVIPAAFVSTPRHLKSGTVCAKPLSMMRPEISFP